MESIKKLKHIYLDKSFFFLLIIIILTGRFNDFIYYFLLLFIHELGHSLTGIIMGYKLEKIIFYPYGGLNLFNLILNIPLKKELLILIMGPIAQVLGYYILRNFYNIDTFHYSILIFNMLPIYPLDGGKIMNNLWCYRLSYLKSFYITFTISLLFITLIIIYNINYFNLNLLIMIIIILYKLLNTFKKR